MELNRLHLEISSKCALKCAACPRTHSPDTFKAGDMPLSQIENIVQSPQSYTSILLCGNYGDPIYHSHFHEAIRLLKTMKGAPPITIGTNGAHRPKDWWVKTAELLRPDDLVLFGIDGLADTNHLYREGTSWDTIDQAIRTLKSNGNCRVGWQWILFKHNEHQLQLAKAQAKEWKIQEFILVESYRINNPGAPTKSISQARQEFFDA